METDEEEKPAGSARSEPTTFDTDVQRSTTRAWFSTSFHQLSQRIPSRHFLFFSRNVRSGSEVGRSNSFSAESETWRNSDTKKKNSCFLFRLHDFFYKMLACGSFYEHITFINMSLSRPLLDLLFPFSWLIVRLQLIIFFINCNLTIAKFLSAAIGPRPRNYLSCCCCCCSCCSCSPFGSFPH